MKRREFLIKGGSVLLILPAGWAVTSCDSDDDDDNDDAGTSASNGDANGNGNGNGTGGNGSSGSGGSGGSNDAAGGGTGGSADTGSGSARLMFTSSVVGGHSHQFELDMVVLQAPPASGLNGVTSLNDGHVHTVELSIAELNQIATGGTVSKDTTLAVGHLHNFQFRR